LHSKPAAINRPFLSHAGRRAFTLAEVVVTCMLLMCLIGYAFPVAQSASERLFNPYSDYNVEREVKEAARWISGQLHKSRALRENITLIVNVGEASPIIRVSRESSPPMVYESWTGNIIAFKVSKSSSAPSAFSYAYNFQHQTMTPALRLDVYRRNSAGSGYKYSGIDMIISGYGRVRFEKNV
jgi:hypothetical protein